MATVVAAEVHFAQRLAGNEKKTRDKAVKRLRKWLQLKAVPTRGDLSDEDLLKIWKGLHYCMWMSDKPLVQEELATTISSLVHCFDGNTSLVFSFIRIFFRTEAREWHGIDRWRMDKFMMLIRRFHHQSLVYLRNKGWDDTHLAQFTDIITTEIIDVDGEGCVPEGLKYHIVDIYLEELSKVGAAQLTASQVSSFLKPFYSQLPALKSQTLVRYIITHLFGKLIDEEVERLRGETTVDDADEDTAPRLEVNLEDLAEKLFEEAKAKSCLARNRPIIYQLVNRLQNVCKGILPDEGTEGVNEHQDPIQSSDISFYSYVCKCVGRLQNVCKGILPDEGTEGVNEHQDPIQSSDISFYSYVCKCVGRLQNVCKGILPDEGCRMSKGILPDEGTEGVNEHQDPIQSSDISFYSYVCKCVGRLQNVCKGILPDEGTEGVNEHQDPIQSSDISFYSYVCKCVGRLQNVCKGILPDEGTEGVNEHQDPIQSSDISFYSYVCKCVGRLQNVCKGILPDEGTEGVNEHQDPIQSSDISFYSYVCKCVGRLQNVCKGILPDEGTEGVNEHQDPIQSSDISFYSYVCKCVGRLQNVCKGILPDEGTEGVNEHQDPIQSSDISFYSYVCKCVGRLQNVCKGILPDEGTEGVNEHQDPIQSSDISFYSYVCKCVGRLQNVCKGILPDEGTEGVNEHQDPIQSSDISSAVRRLEKLDKHLYEQSGLSERKRRKREKLMGIIAEEHKLEKEIKKKGKSGKEISSENDQSFAIEMEEADIEEVAVPKKARKNGNKKEQDILTVDVNINMASSEDSREQEAPEKKKHKKKKKVTNNESINMLISENTEENVKSKKKRKSIDNVSSTNSSETVPDDPPGEEVDIWIPNKKYKGKFSGFDPTLQQGKFPCQKHHRKTEVKAAPASFAQFEEGLKTPPAFVRKAFTKLRPPQTEPVKKSNKMTHVSNGAHSAVKKRVSFDMKRNTSQDFNDSMNVSAEIPFNPETKPDQSILKSPLTRPRLKGSNSKTKGRRLRASDFF
ncbi:uncharacterized protein LOC135465986 [Liolophura sinensis]|uniref:uncharacterized protein LOC135465986 n=1 Tax=Liolophura sinensis TaxID=3198878 RepID=UPI0031589213